MIRKSTTRKPLRDNRADWRQLQPEHKRAPAGSGGGRKGTPNT